MQTQTGHKRWTAFAAAAVAAGAIGCGDLTTDTAPAGSGEPSSVETKQGAVAATPSRALDPKTRFFIPPPNPGAVQQVVVGSEAGDDGDSRSIANADQQLTALVVEREPGDGKRRAGRFQKALRPGSGGTRDLELAGRGREVALAAQDAEKGEIRRAVHLFPAFSDDVTAARL